MPLNSKQSVALLKPAKDLNEVGNGVKGRWYLSHTTGTEYLSKRNVQLNINYSASREPELTLSWQSLTSTVMEKDALNNIVQRTGKEESHDQPKVLAMGKEGVLMDGFKETEWGIEDEAGTSMDF